MNESKKEIVLNITYISFALVNNILGNKTWSLIF